MVWRDREIGPVHPAIRSAPSTGTFGTSRSVTTFMAFLSSCCISGPVAYEHMISGLDLQHDAHRNQCPAAQPWQIARNIPTSALQGRSCRWGGDTDMATTIRVGMVGVTPSRGFSSIAHMPALRALPDFEVVAVCTTRQETADAAAKHYGVPLAFADPVQLAQHPDVDLVTVCVKVPDHFTPVMAAIDAGKHVYSEWPLGRNTAEASKLLDAAESKGVRHAIGLQGRVSPSINYVRDLIAE